MARKPTGAAYAPADYDVVIIQAVKALSRGDATEDQQRRALGWIINIAAGTYDMSYRSGADGDRDTAFAEGRRFVGTQIVKMVNMPPEAIQALRRKKDG